LFNNARSLEQKGVAAVAIAQDSVITYVAAKYDGPVFKYDNGMPVRSAAILPPVSGSSLEVQREKLFGLDPLEGIPLYQEIIDALITPLGESYCTHDIPEVTLADGSKIAGELYSGPAPQSTVQPRYMPANTAENIKATWESLDRTDYRPLIMPTQARVTAMLAGSSRGASPTTIHKTSTWPSGNWRITVELAAVYSVMAGATPAMFPACLAMIAAGHVPYGNSTTSFMATTMITGDWRMKLGVNSGGDAFSPSSYGADVLGRVAVFASKAVNMHVNRNSARGVWDNGSWQQTDPNYPQPGHFVSLGTPSHYEMLVIGDNQEAYPSGWTSKNGDQGYTASASYICTSTGWTTIVHSGHVTAGGLPPQDLMAYYMGGTIGTNTCSLYMSPATAAILHDVYGFATKAQLLNYFPLNVSMTARQFWGNGVTATMQYTQVRSGTEPYSSYATLINQGNAEAVIHPYTSSNSFRVYVVGDADGQATWHLYENSLGAGTSIDSYA